MTSRTAIKCNNKWFQLIELYKMVYNDKDKTYMVHGENHLDLDHCIDFRRKI